MANMNDVEMSSGPIRPITIINMLAGIWLFVSPWVYGAYTNGTAWNSWIVGALIVLFAAIHYSSPSMRSLSIINMLLGIWTFFSPWIYGYAGNSGRFINSLCVGVIVFIVGAFGSASYGHTTHHGTPPPVRP